MKKLYFRVYKVMLLVFVSLLLVGCASKDMSKHDSGSVDPARPAETAVWDDGFKGDVDEDLGGYTDGEAKVEETQASSGGETSNTKGNVLYDSNDKIIRKINLSLETQAFDELVNSIETQIGELGGYIESSRITGRHYNSDNLRYGTIVARVPKETVNGFVNNLGNIANITEKAENVENVTLQYVDIESRIQALEIEQERLLTLLERAQDIEVIISLESRLTNVRYELQSLNTQIRTIDNLVDFSTVTMEIQEVRLMSVGIDTEESIGDRIARETRESFYRFKENFADFVVWFVVSLPYIIFWVIIIVIAVFLLKRFRNKLRLNKRLKYMDYGENVNHESNGEESNINSDNKE